jgi:hypothetical protein
MSGVLLRDQITRSAWFRNGLSDRERRQRVKEVETFWHLKAEEARDLLETQTHLDPLKGAG